MTDIVNETTGRLIVLLPACLSQNMALARKINRMALRERREVVYLSLIDEQEDYLPTTRCMTTFAAMTASSQLNVQVKTVLAAAWLPSLRGLYRAGDVLVCQAEQVVRTGWMKTAPVSQFLRAEFQGERVNLVELNGFYHPGRVQAGRWLHQISFIIGCLMILVVFSMLEFQLDQSIDGAARTVLLSLLVFFEFGAIWAWSQIARR